MEAYLEMISLSSRFFQIIGMGMFHLKWHPGRVLIIMGYQFLSIISNGFVSYESVYLRDINVFSTCVVILSATALVVVKIMILLGLSKEFNNCFRWIEMCFCEQFHNEDVDAIWTNCRDRCKKDTLFFTRILYRLYFACITIMFVFNLSFNRNDPPLEFYAVFIGKTTPFYYIGNFIYQLFLFFDLLLCAAAVESSFIMLTIFVTCRINFVLELIQFIDDEKKKCKGDVLGLINFAVDIHVDVLRQISKISDLFKTILLIQLCGSLGSFIFSLYVLQSHFYFTMIFAALSPVGQVFVYCYLGDLLTQKADQLPDKIYCTNWETFSLTEQKHLLVVMRQSQKRIFLSVGGLGKLTLSTFVELAKTAYSFCAVLSTMSM